MRRKTRTNPHPPFAFPATYIVLDLLYDLFESLLARLFWARRQRLLAMIRPPARAHPGGNHRRRCCSSKVLVEGTGSFKDHACTILE